jgi:serine/tyrosine/threonine adenylyltransferase
MSLSASYRPERAILELGEEFYDPVAAADFPKAILRFRNDKAAAEVGLETLDDQAWVRHFARFEPLPDNLPEPLALRYHGHQFRVYNPDIGDGRGFLFAQMRDGAGRLMDLGTKGSGQTPWSRFGDGRLTLKGGVREVLATEMLEALGVETSRTFSLIETGEALTRGDEPSPTRSAVMVRLSHGHIRIGTFQRLAYLDQPENLRRLVDYCLRHYYPADAQPPAPAHLEAPPGAEPPAEDPAATLLRHVVARTARLAASYIAAGFVHGVLNSDNINITGESFDYGPWRWTPFWDGHFTAAYFDHAGLYSFGRQPEAIHWDVLQLAMSLRTIAPAEPLTEALGRFPDLFQDALRERLCWRLGIAPADRSADAALLLAIEQALVTQTVSIDRFFFDWRGGRRRGPSPAGEAYEAAEFKELAATLEARTPLPGATDHPYWSDAEPCSMHIEEVEAIWRRIDTLDDWSALEAKVAAVRRMAEAHRRLP